MTSAVDEATLDVCIERLTRQHPRAQLFIFHARGEPFWARFAPTPGELEVLPEALSLIERALETGTAPLTGAEPGGRFTFLVVDAEATWFAVVFRTESGLPAQTRARPVAGRLLSPANFPHR
ncbi:MAG: hypothetical protein IT380_01755 [Myxococcales bacterium]|nr:hypothetical protein [Myxococcales bacterium]